MPAHWRNINRGFVAALVCSATFGLAVPASHAGEPPDGMFFMLWDASNDNLDPFQYNPAEFGSVNWGTWQLGGGPNGQGGPPRERTGWRYQGGLENEEWALDWDCVVNPNPFVDATINVTNTSASTQTFTLYMPLAIAMSINGGTLMNGSVSAVVTASSFAGALLETDGVSPIYQAYIDTVPLGANGQMWGPPYSLAAGSFGTANDNDSFSGAIGPDANFEIALRLRFDLSPGDSASVTGIFQVEPIPNPASLSLLALAGLVGRRRRR